VPLAGFLQSKRFTSATAWTTPSPTRTREVTLARRGMAAALLRAPPAGASRSRGPGAALAASASSRQCLEELPRNRSLPSTSFHEPVPPPAGEPTARGVAAAWNAPTRGAPLAQDPTPHATHRLRGRSGSRLAPRPDHVQRVVRRAAPAKGKPGSLHPRCLPADEKDPLCTWLTHRLSPTCGVKAPCPVARATDRLRRLRSVAATGALAGRATRKWPLERRALVALHRPT